jgi:hypothetical protein
MGNVNQPANRESADGDQDTLRAIEEELQDAVRGHETAHSGSARAADDSSSSPDNSPATSSVFGDDANGGKTRLYCAREQIAFF